MIVGIVCLSNENDDFGVYAGSRMLYRGTLDECLNFRWDRV